MRRKITYKISKRQGNPKCLQEVPLSGLSPLTHWRLGILESVFLGKDVSFLSFAVDEDPLAAVRMVSMSWALPLMISTRLNPSIADVCALQESRNGMVQTHHGCNLKRSL